MSLIHIKPDIIFVDDFAQEGYDDFILGYEKEDCPYEEGTDGQNGWLIGWNYGNSIPLIELEELI